MHEGPACLPLHRLATFRSSQQASGGPPKHRYAMGRLTSGLVIASWAPISFVFLLGGANGEPHASDGGGCREVGSMPSGSNGPRKERGGRGRVPPFPRPLRWLPTASPWFGRNPNISKL